MARFKIEKEVSIDAPPNIVFEALTNSDKILQYYPLRQVISTWKTGGEIILKGSNNHKDFTDYGKIDIFKSNEKFQYTYWSDNHGTERVPENYLTICYTLNETNERTKLKLEHRNLHSEKMYLEMLQVWDFLLSSLKNFVETQ